ncbi:Uu.00g021490.m01.CDS01 [Anthostomella pinea]|uniref:E3 ubiquitin-protein ligase listerin n=1 Tax=Anthostomella pinea TaxID=933095 RepID=A0AAI8YQX4_9PEZI|nr:Uu.00g021490.m01.CDS01 [Anthostomella pinea]
MSRKPGKSRAASSKAFTSFGTNSAFGGGFSTSSSGANLSYLAEPPDFTSISDANVVVSLKNLQKKDATTKAKALEELVAYVQSHPYDQDGGTEEPILEAWVQLYPRISIDNSRRVRELSHALQFELMTSARKRMEKHIPKIVGSWLVGTFDRDRAVSRVATEGLSSFLTTPEKVTQFWKRCQQQILDYASDAIKETTDTLSDQRSTNTDDAETKYHRVLAGSLALVLNLLQKLEPADTDKCLDSYDQFFEENKVWASATINDPVVRRLSCQLLSTCLSKRPGRIEADLARLSKVFVAEGLKSPQSGSATDYVVALTNLTEKHPSVWTSEYRGKKSPISRLKVLLERGSQGGTARFWSSLTQLLSILPDDVLPKDPVGIAEFLKSLRSGLTSRDEPRANAVDAWSTYLAMTRHFMKTVQSSDARQQLVEENIFPLTAHYLHPTPETSMWASGSQIPILIKVFTSTATSAFEDMVEATRVEWDRLKEIMKDNIRNSLPEASKEHQKSQKSVADEGKRWFILTGTLLDAHERTVSTDRPIPDIPKRPSLELLGECVKLLETRNWKPFGPAATVESAFNHAPSLFKSSSGGISDVLECLETSLPESKEEFLTSSAAPYLFSSIILLGQIPERKQDFEKIWEANTATLVECIESPGAVPALTKLISSKCATPIAQQMPILQTELIRRCLMCAVGNSGSSWELFDAIVTYDTLTESAANRLLKEFAGRVMNSTGQPNQGVIRGLQYIAQKKPELLSHDEEIHMTLMTNLLSLSERPGVGPEIMALRSLMEIPPSGRSRLLGLLQENINNANAGSLSVDTLVQQAMQAQESIDTSAIESDRRSELLALLPDAEKWRHELSFLLQETPNPSLALTSSLGGAYFLPVTASTRTNTNSPRDRSGFSIPGRMAMYTAKLLSAGFDLAHLALSTQVEIVISLSLTAELATDQLTVMSENQIWSSLGSEVLISEAENLISTARKAVMRLTEDAPDWRDGSGPNTSRLMNDIIRTLIEEAKSVTPKGLYCARVLNEILQGLTEKHGFPSSGEQWLTDLGVLKSAPSTVLPGVAILTGLGETVSASRAVSNFCNRLVSDIAGASPGQEKTLVILVLLNACTQIYDIGELPVANNRLVFAVKQITSWLESPEELDYRFAAEACRSLQRLLPCVKDVYGSYWERTVDFCIYLWTKQMAQSLDCRLPEIHASLRILSILQSLEDPNDDLVDVLQSSAERRSAALIELLKLPRERDTQPLEIVDSFIRRQIDKLPLHHVKDPSELYAVAASEYRTIQTAAFTVLHKALPAAQEQLSVDVLLEKNTARLPDELLSLLLDAPTLDAYPDDVLARFPTPIRSYLLSWHLVFDSFSFASFKVRGDYAENLKSANYIAPLMDFTFDVLGHSAARGLNLERAGFTSENIRAYDLKLAEAETEERNMQWILIHLFYLVLKYLPGLFKSWYIECRSKQTKIAVEGWMAKYFSPIIISEALDDVVKWTDNQEAPADDEKELIVKVSRAAREVTAGYEVDELHASIAIRIPQEYPLQGVTVVGVNRVAVNEKKWQSWIMSTQGVITFSGGSIIDGLTAFRRNVVGAMKGQSECAICYSIISSDKKMPDKRCQTCKNLFHRTCLYKWFQSSSQNTCPLCRNPIDYLGADTQARRGA